jgi:small subunit ribosomal protein S8e
MYNASNNELVRTKTLVKGAIVVVDATPFRQWYGAHYGMELGKKENKGKQAEVNLSGKSNSLVRKIQSREKAKNTNPMFFDQFMSCVYSPPPRPSASADFAAQRRADSRAVTK